jgi:hypothetical protein
MERKGHGIDGGAIDRAERVVPNEDWGDLEVAGGSNADERERCKDCLAGMARRGGTGDADSVTGD